MTRYFTSRQGAIKRLMEIKRAFARNDYALLTIEGWRSDGAEIRGIEQVLLNARAGRIRWFRHADAHEEQLVFIS